MNRLHRILTLMVAGSSAVCAVTAMSGAEPKNATQPPAKRATEVAKAPSKPAAAKAGVDTPPQGVGPLD